jgi:hypothetical protein
MFFEVDDIKRRHSPYADTYNVHGWLTNPDSANWWTFLRTSVAGIAGAGFSAVHKTYLEGYKQLRTKYDPPKDLSQKVAYLKNIPKTQGFKTVCYGASSVMIVWVVMMRVIFKFLVNIIFIFYKILRFTNHIRACVLR